MYVCMYIHINTHCFAHKLYFYFSALCKILYIQYLHDPNSPQEFLPKLYETRKKHTQTQTAA